MHEQNENIKFLKTVENNQTYPGAEKYSYWIENFTRGVQQQSWSGRRKKISEHEERSFEVTETEEQKENRIKKIDEHLRDYGTPLNGPYTH